jgi:hypothetical protein
MRGRKIKTAVVMADLPRRAPTFYSESWKSSTQNGNAADSSGSIWLWKLTSARSR